VFEHLDQHRIRNEWLAALERAKLADPQPVIHDLRHTHVSGLIADGWDPVEVAARIGDTLQTTLSVYAHEFDARRRSEARRGALEARYGSGMATHKPPQSARDAIPENAEITDLQVFRNSA
jgi:integrase